MFLRTFFAAFLVTAAVPAIAANSAPQPVPIVDTIPPAKDVAYPGTMMLKIDATDLDRNIFSVQQTIPVASAGPMTLLFPQWLPGAHSPQGQLDKIANLVIKAGGKTLVWKRDPVDVYAIHVDVPAGTKALDLSFQFLSATVADQGRIVVTREMLNLQWNSMSFYPAGYFTRRIPVSATVTYPKGWKAATALRPAASAKDSGGDTITYETTNYEVLVDSPVFAGRYFRKDDLGHGVTLNTVGDSAAEIKINDAVLGLHRNLIDQAVKLFGAQHFDHYDFLHAISDRMGSIGLEHQRSSENRSEPGYHTDWAASLQSHNLLPHEFTHSWNGKFRRPADLWTPDYHMPMRGSLLWVYEGQTQFWGYVLEARSGLSSKQDVLDKLAGIAAILDNRPARTWRSLDDTTNDPVIAQRRPKGWLSNQRSEDYYNEGLLIWTEADAIIREGTRGAKGMDDFARAFFGINDGDWGQVTYTFNDVVATLNTVMPYDWNAFLTARLTEKNKGAPLGGFERSGYKLVYTDTPTNAATRAMKSAKNLDLSYSLGMTIAKAKITLVQWDGPAFKAGMTVGPEIIAVNGTPYTEEVLKAAITAAKGGNAPIRLTTRTDTLVRDVNVQWNGGLLYPRFEKAAGAPDGPLDKLLVPR
ncbi:MAG: peptidase M61 [Sphingomonadales bacterium]